MAAIEDLVRDFRLAAMEKGDEGGPLDGPLYDQLRACFHELRALGSAGHAAFRSLLQDPSPTVRGWVAAQLLAEGSTEVLPILRELAEQPGVGGLNATMVIEEHEAGRLKGPFGDAAA